MADSSNIDEIAEMLDALVAGIRFDMPGKDQSLGRDAAGIVAEGIVERTTVEQKSADGGALRPNEARYAARKLRRYHSDTIGIRTGQMLSLQSVLGEVAIGPESVELRYGVGAPPDRAATGVPLADSDRAVTDRDKAGYFSEDRPFYGLDSTIADAVVAEAASILDDYLAKQ